MKTPHLASSILHLFLHINVFKCDPVGFSPCIIVEQAIPIIDNFRQIMLSEHNKYRNIVAKGYKQLPPAKSMYQLSYKYILEILSICESVWACQKEIDPPIVLGKCPYQLPSFYLKTLKYKIKNKASIDNSYNVTLNAVNVVAQWFAEINNLTESSVATFQNNVQVRHIAKMSWWPLSGIGCARSYNLITNQEYHVCYYATTTKNVQFGYGEPIYLKGAPCTGCPEDLPCNSDSLLCGSLDEDKLRREESVFEAFPKDMHSVNKTSSANSYYFNVNSSYISIILLVIIIIKLH